ncbi:MAG: energy-coupling factor transporter ATPase [Clostridiales bacterium]|nr:energy-coupling factor transporter ATPase [Clostridiales bacterium]
MQIVSKGLTFTYNKKSDFKKTALSGVDVTINEGEFFGIVGETGSGKSTFIQHLNGLIRVQDGSLTVGEYNLNPTDKNGKKQLKKQLKELRYKVGMVFQYPEYQLFAETVFDDVAFGLKNFHPELSSSEVALKVQKALEVVGLDYDAVKNKSPFELSGGQKRRVALAGILVSEPEILVLDEPVAGLDPVGKKRLMSLLHTLHDTGVVKTIIIVSHDMDEISENVTRVALFRDGKAVKVCTPKELFSKNDDSADRLGLPVTAYVQKELEKIGVQIDTDYKSKDFIEKIIEKYKSLNK